MERELRSLAQKIEVRRDAAGQPKAFTGAAIVFGQRSENFGGFVEVIQPGALDRTIMDDVVGLFNHNNDVILGRNTAGTLTLIRTANGLSYEIPYDAQDPDHVRVMRKIQKGEVVGSSFQFRFADEGYEYREAKDGTMERQVKSIAQIYDVGPVTFPAYRQSTASKRAFEQQCRRFEQYDKRRLKHSRIKSNINI